MALNFRDLARVIVSNVSLYTVYVRNDMIKPKKKKNDLPFELLKCRFKIMFFNENKKRGATHSNNIFTKDANDTLMI